MFLGFDEMRARVEQVDFVRPGAEGVVRGGADHSEGLQVLQRPEEGRRSTGQRGQGRNRHSELLQEIQRGTENCQSSLVLMFQSNLVVKDQLNKYRYRHSAIFP